jgi:hypothetical protein
MFQRAAWVPYFKEITALIFLAPLSSFDETLAEDPTINRLEDTFMLWKTICSNKLLARVQIVSSQALLLSSCECPDYFLFQILFMNKVDILRKKLESGILVKNHIPEFRDKSNDFETVSNCECKADYLVVAPTDNLLTFQGSRNYLNGCTSPTLHPVANSWLILHPLWSVATLSSAQSTYSPKLQWQDTEATTQTLAAVQSAILRNDFVNTGLL